MFPNSKRHQSSVFMYLQPPRACGKRPENSKTCKVRAMLVSGRISKHTHTLDKNMHLDLKGARLY